MQLLKQAVCKEIVATLRHIDWRVRKKTVIALRKPRFMLSRIERAQIDYFMNEKEYLQQLLESLVSLINDPEKEVQKVAINTLADFNHPRYKGAIYSGLEVYRNMAVEKALAVLEQLSLNEPLVLDIAQMMVSLQDLRGINALTAKLNGENFCGSHIKTSRLKKAIINKVDALKRMS